MLKTVDFIDIFFNNCTMMGIAITKINTYSLCDIFNLFAKCNRDATVINKEMWYDW